MTTPTADHPPDRGGGRQTFVPWRDILAAALDQAEVIAVAQLVEERLGRPPTRSEITSARRAANALVARGRAQRFYVESRPGHPTGRRLLLTRPAADLSDYDTLAASAASQSAQLPRRGPARSDLQITRGLVRTMTGVSNAARLIDAQRLPPDTAAELAAELSQSLREVEQLRHRLVLRQRQG